MKTRDNTMYAVASQVKIKNVKIGIRIPASIIEAYKLDRYNANTIWRDAISRYMENVSIAFNVLEDGKKPSAAHI